jgi:RNA polymerase sigma-70 factor (ECF subfamily)
MTTLASAPSHEGDLLDGLRRGEEDAFADLVDRLHGSMCWVARGYVASDAVAEEVVQETWAAVLDGLGAFQGRSALKTWIFRILVNRAKTTGVRERRTVPFSALDGGEASPEGVVDHLLSDPPAGPGAWAAAGGGRSEPEARLLACEVRRRLFAALETLCPAQRAVVTLRDVEGLSAEAVCDLLGIRPGNQRVLLHRGRARVRLALAGYVD